MAAAGIGAAGSVAGGVAAGKGAKKAAKTAAKTAAADRAQALELYNQNVDRYQGDITTGDKAGQMLANAMGINGVLGSDEIYNAYRNTTGYQEAQDAGLGAINTNAYAKGTANSGATLKALQSRGDGIQRQYYGNYLTGLQNIQGVGSNAKSALTGAGNVYAAQSTSANQSAGQAQANAQLAQGNAFGNTISSLGNITSSYLGNQASNYAIQNPTLGAYTGAGQIVPSFMNTSALNTNFSLPNLGTLKL